ncbi:MAG: zinc-dependent metalloprotease [Acidimicrobiales bacterium]
MSGFGPTGENPFEGIPFLNDLSRMMRSSGPVNWDAARQFAVQVATGGAVESNPDPLERMRLDELFRVADLRVADATGLPTSTTGALLSVTPVTRHEWTIRTLDAYRPLLERLAASLSLKPTLDPNMPHLPDGPDQFFEGMFSLITPLMLGMQAGAMVGNLATRSLGQFDLPLPRPASDELLVVSPNLHAFSEEWSLQPDDLFLWVALSELTHHVVLGLPHVRNRLEGLVLDYVKGFQLDPEALQSSLEGVDPTDPQGIQRALGDPTVLLGVMRSPQQALLTPQLEALVTVIAGYVDHILDTVGTTLIGTYGQLTEALRRRRLEASAGDQLVEHLFGLHLGRDQYERGSAFVAGVLERGGDDGLARLWTSERELPTPAEVDAPGLWLARIDLPA